MDISCPIDANPSYSLEEAIMIGLDAEEHHDPQDLGPIDTLEDEALERECDLFFGTSPLSSISSLPPSPSSSTRPSRTPSPQREERERAYDKSFGTSPLSSPPPSRTPSIEREARARAHDESFGTSPLSSPPPSPSLSSRSISSSLVAAEMPVVDPVPPPSTSANSLKPKPTPTPPSTATTDLQGSETAAKTSNSKTRRNKRKGHANRFKKRQEEAAQHGKRPPNMEKHIAAAEITQTSYDTSNIPSASTGFIALPDDGPGKCHKLRTLLRRYRLKLIRWNGRVTRAILDSNKRVIAILAGCPNDDDWDSVHRECHSTLLSARTRCKFYKKTVRHRRGNYPALNVGISYGGGQKMPGNLKHEECNAAELASLLKQKCFQRVAGFASRTFMSWAPKLHAHYDNNLNSLLGKHSGLRRNFSNSVFSACTFNFGPKVFTKSHRDHANLPYGWCSVTALGEFDPTKGGHLVLWDLGLVIEFPPGSTILLPSAAISHFNTPIQRSESRSSFTQYTAGGLFRWVAHGYQSDPLYFKDKTPEDLARITEANKKRCKLGLSLFSTIDEIRKIHGL